MGRIELSQKLMDKITKIVNRENIRDIAINKFNQRARVDDFVIMPDTNDYRLYKVLQITGHGVNVISDKGRTKYIHDGLWLNLGKYPQHMIDTFYEELNKRMPLKLKIDLI